MNDKPTFSEKCRRNAISAAYDLDVLEHELKCASDMVFCLYTAAESGKMPALQNAESPLCNALLSLHTLLDGLCSQHQHHLAQLLESLEAGNPQKQ